MYLVSVIIPVYNAEKTLEQALRSVKKQTLGFEHIELLLCDDHSTDGSLALMQRWAAKYPNVRALQTEANSGSASVPRNICMAHATAPYFMFLDNDDLLEKDACAVLLSEMERSGADIVGGCYSELHYGRKLYAVPYYDAVPERDFDFPAQLPEFRAIADPFWSKIFRAQIIRENRLHFESDLYGEDSLFLIQYLVCCKTARHIKKNIYNYRIREDSLFHIFNKEHILGAFRADEMIRKCLLGAGQKAYYDDLIRNHFSEMMDVLANTCDICDEDVPEIMEAWRPYAEYVAQQKLGAKTPYGELLLDDAVNGWDKAASHMLQLRRICAQKNAQYDEVLNSRGWKLLTAVNRLLGR